MSAVAKLLSHAGKSAVRKSGGAPPLQQIWDLNDQYMQSGRYTDFFEVASEEEVLEHTMPDSFLDAVSGKVNARSFRDARSSAMSSSFPSDLPRFLHDTVAAELGRQVVQPPPFTVKLGRKKNAATSARKEYLQDWLESDEGKVWRAERALMFAD